MKSIKTVILDQGCITMNDIIKYVYRIKGKKCSHFYLLKEFVVSKLKSSNEDEDNKLLSYLEDNSINEIIDSLQNDYSYRMRYVLNECPINSILKYYCPYCCTEYKADTLYTKKEVVDKGSLWYGEEYQYFCAEHHKIFWVRGFVS